MTELFCRVFPLFPLDRPGKDCTALEGKADRICPASFTILLT